MFLTIAGSEEVDTRSIRLELITNEETLLQEATLQRKDGNRFIAKIIPRTRQPFTFRFSGTTRGGNPFQRMSRKPIAPTTVVFRYRYASNNYTLPLMKVTFIYFQLCNFGFREYFEVTSIKDKMKYILSTKFWPRSVRKGRCTVFFLRAKATRSQDLNQSNTFSINVIGRESKVFALAEASIMVVK